MAKNKLTIEEEKIGKQFEDVSGGTLFTGDVDPVTGKRREIFKQTRPINLPKITDEVIPIKTPGLTGRAEFEERQRLKREQRQKDLTTLTPDKPKLPTDIKESEFGVSTEIPKLEIGEVEKIDVDSGSPILDKRLQDIKKEKDKKIEDTKKSFLLGKSEFDKNKQYYTNFDEVNNIYTGVIDELTNSMDENGVVPDRRYLEIANKYGLTVDEVKDPNSILNRGNLSEEGKEKFGVDKFQAGLDKLATQQERNLADLQTALARTQENYNFQIENVGKQIARNIGWTEAQGAWMGALRGSGFLQGIENIRKDGETTINRLKTLSQQASEATGESAKRLTEDYNLALEEATKSLDNQLEDLQKNSILSLSEAQATYGLGSDKLSSVLDAINDEYGIKSNQAVTAYLGNLKSMNELAKQNIDLIEQADRIETVKTDKVYNSYLANNGAVLQNTSLNTISEQIQSGSITVARAKDLQNIMLNSIQATLGAIAPLTTQDLSTINTLLAQGNTPAQVIAKMREDERFKAPVEVGDFQLLERGGKTFKFNKDTGEFEVIDGVEGKIVTPTGSYSEFKHTNESGTTKNVKVDDVATPSLEIALKELGDSVILGDSFRTTAQQKVNYDKFKAGTGGLASKPGTSKHETGLAIDVYSGVDENGKLQALTADQVKIMNKNGWEQTAGAGDMGHFEFVGKPELEAELTQSDIAKFNNTTFKPNSLKKQSDKDKFIQFKNKQDEIFNDPEADFYDVIAFSDGSGRGSVSERDKIGKYAQVLGGLKTLTGLVKSKNTGPVAGRLMKLDPYSTSVAEFKAVIAGLVPTVARGIFNEVGVLTNEDVERYLGTLPTLEKTEDQNKLVILALLRTLSDGMKSQLDTMARSDVNVSKFEGRMKVMDREISELETSIGGGITGTTETTTTTINKDSSDEDIIKLLQSKE